MKLILGLLASALLTLQTGLARFTQKNPTSPPELATITTMCLNDKTAAEGIDPGNLKIPKILKSIKKASSSNTTEGYEIAQCQGKGGCGGPDISDYRLVATNVRIDHTVYPNAFEAGNPKSDRQLVKQFDFSDDPILKDRYKNRIYKTFCGDWCYTCPPANVSCDAEGLNCSCSTSEAITLPYRGSFHCDFVFYLQDEDDEGKIQIDDYGEIPQDRINPIDPNLPKDKSFFSVYFRIGASLPDNIRCKNQSKSKDIFSIAKLFGIKPVLAESYSGATLIYPADQKIQWLLETNRNSKQGSFKARNTQITTDIMQEFKDPTTGTNIINNPLGIKGSFAVYKNLLDPENLEFIYLVEKDKIKDMLSGIANKNALKISVFEYFRLAKVNTTEGAQKTVKLGKFKPPLAKTWINKWAEESKPAIYIYPPYPVQLSVKLHTKGEITVSDPLYLPFTGWNVMAYPDGTIFANQRPYPYLYYEANLESVKIEKSGKVVKETDLAPFLNSSLRDLGLNNKETKDFLDYWIPRLEGVNAPYFFIHFLDEKQIEELEGMETSISINSSIRIRAYFKPLDYPVSVSPQKLSSSVVREGLTVVEWGGILDRN